MNFKEKVAQWDAMYSFPRPANEQYLSSYKAFLRLSKDAGVIGLSFLLSALSTGLLYHCYSYAIETFELYYLDGIGALVGLLAVVLLLGIWVVFFLDIVSVNLPYNLIFQRESHGGRTWATLKDLENSTVDAVRPATANIEGKGIFLAPFKRALFSLEEAKYQIFLSLTRLSQALIIFGPPGSGKSSTFFIPVIRQFAACGGAIVLDVKGELYNFTAHYYANVYRLDIMNPYFSDWFDLFGGCYRNPDKARRIASYLVGYDPNKSSSKEPIWDQSAVLMLTVIILYLCEKKEHPTPRDILRFLAENPITDKRFNPDIGKFSPYSPLTEAFDMCDYAYVRETWKNNFSKMPEDTFGSVKFNTDTALTQLLSPKVNEILRPPTEAERKKGRRRIDFTQLRRKYSVTEDGAKKERGTAVYVVVSPSDAINMDVFLRVVFSVALDTLRESAIEGSNVLVALDEAGNVPLSKMPEGINTDRSKGICYFLGYQDKNQPVSQYGREAANSFLGTAGVNIFLPGVDDDTADIASKRIGDTTILQKSSSDAKNNSFDSEKLSEAGRKLILPQDLTAMPWFTQCVITIKGAAPIRAKIPNDAKKQDTRISNPREVIENVSEEVNRLLGILGGREHTPVKPVEIETVAPSLRIEKQNDSASKAATSSGDGVQEKSPIKSEPAPVVDSPSKGSDKPAATVETSADDSSPSGADSDDNGLFPKMAKPDETAAVTASPTVKKEGSDGNFSGARKLR